MQFLNTLTVLALVVMSFALIVAVPVLYASSEDSGRSNRLILLGSAAWVALVLLNWGVVSSSSEFVMATFEGRFTDASGLRIAVVARFNDLVTAKLLSGCLDCLARHGIDTSASTVSWMWPGCRGRLNCRSSRSNWRAVVATRC